MSVVEITYKSPGVIEIEGVVYEKVVETRNSAIHEPVNTINPETPLPYKGMNVRTEIARTIMPEIISYHANHTGNNMDSPDVIEEIAIDTLRYTDALIKQLNKK